MGKSIKIFSKEIQEKISQLEFLPPPSFNNLTGETFGRLYVLGRAPIPYGHKTFWWCICLKDNNIKRVMGTSLISGNTKSCGCLRKEKASKNAIIRNTSENKPGFGNRKNLTNQMFGFLKAIEPTKERFNDGSVIWKCICTRDNNIVYASSHLLLNHSIQSCGCINSLGEAKIENILQQNNIKYKKQYTFTNLLSEKNSPLKFDFAILNEDNSLSHLIEYDGSQHFKYQGTGWNTQEHLEYTQKHDQMKNDYCKNNNIHLIRIHYSQFDNLKLEDLINYDN